MNALRYILNIILLLGVFYMGYNLYKTIEEPITFEAEKAIRDKDVVAKLKKIRITQMAYKSLYNKYASDFDTLITVVKTDSFNVVKQLGDPNDSTVVVKTFISKKSILDSLFKEDKSEIDNLPIIPNSNGERFAIQADTIRKNEVVIPAFEVSAPYETIYQGLIKKYYSDKWGQNMRVGSITEGTTTGNWEK